MLQHWFIGMKLVLIPPGGDWDGGTIMSFDIIFRDGKVLFWYAAAPTRHGDETQMTIQIGSNTG